MGLGDMSFIFDSKFEVGSNFIDREVPTDELKNEPMLFSCDRQTAMVLGGPLTRAFMDSLQYEFHEAMDLIVDSRVHMLMPNFWPCIPGWHHDDVPRSDRTKGQPDYYQTAYKSKHVMGLINGDVAPTQFAVGRLPFPDINWDKNEKYYKVWSPIVDDYISAGLMRKEAAPSNKLVFFDNHAFHTGIAAVKTGWRFFIRASINTARKPLNEIRRQVQVYLKDPAEGW